MVTLSGQTVVVVGLGTSGMAAARLCARLGATRILLNDAAPADTLRPDVRALTAEPGMELWAGGHDQVPWRSADLIVLSPGVPPPAPLQEAQAAGVPVVGELELAWRCLANIPTVAVGGTNGKSTTTSLLGVLFSMLPGRAFVGGNLGTPLATLVPGLGEAPPKVGTLVLEVSSFQAETLVDFHPQAATLLNITPDHLDRYASFAAYAAAKGAMVQRMGPADTVVIPVNDALCKQEAERSRARLLTFGGGGDIDVRPTEIVDQTRGHRYAREEIRLVGAHNLANAAAAIGVASSMEVPYDTIVKGLRTFAGLPHRIALVGEMGGVRFYDDSKGTNVGAAVAAVAGLAEPRVVLIAGGRDKGGDYGPLVDILRQRGRALIVIGEAAGRIRAASAHAIETLWASSLPMAVRAARELALPGDAVLLSPACSSFDMFHDYKHRGEVFSGAVRDLIRDDKARAASGQDRP